MTFDARITLQMKNTEMNTYNNVNAWFSKEYATYLEKLENLEAAKVAADKGLEVALEEAKKGSWKWQGRKTTEEAASVVKARETIKTVEASIVLLKKSYEVITETISQLRAYNQEREELNAWYAGGPEPASVKIDQEKERAELLAGCVVLKRGGPPEEHEQEEGDDNEWLQISALDYALSLIPPPVEVKEEEQVSAIRNGRSKFFLRFLKRKQEKDRAAAAPV